MKILVACEESQRVTIELRKLGHEAYSCDVEECSGGHPEWHLQQDVTEILNKKWDMIIAFPPCTYLTSVGTRHYSLKCNTKEKVNKRIELRKNAYNFFMMFVNANCNKIAIENPVGYMNTHYRKPDQIIHPYFFGEPIMKRTCLWLKGLPKLEPTNMLQKPEPIYICKGEKSKGKKIHWCEALKSRSAKERSKTFKGIAKAMAKQWTNID